MAGRRGFDDDFSTQYSESVNGNNDRPRIMTTHDGRLDPSLLPRTEGYIYKKGGTVNARGGRRNWRRRYFVLTNVDFRGKPGYELRYYDGPNGKLKGTLGLSEAEIYCEARSRHKSVKYEFQLLLPNGNLLQLSCDDADVREEWIASLNMAIAYLRKVITSSSTTLNGYDPVFADDEEIHEIGNI